MDYDAGMLGTIRDLMAHKGHANAAMLGAVGAHDVAVADADLSALLHHVLLANRFWILSVLGLPFVVEDEARPSRSFDELVQRFADMQAQESTWLATAAESDFARVLVDSRIPGGQCTVGDAFLQVCLHSHGHRAQIAKRLRQLGGVPPTTDFINWIAHRPAAVWPTSGSTVS